MIINVLNLVLSPRDRCNYLALSFLNVFELNSDCFVCNFDSHPDQMVDEKDFYI